MKMRLIVAGLVLALSGCGTVSGWFGHGPDKPKPAALVDFKPAASLTEAWKAKRATPRAICFAPRSKAAMYSRRAAAGLCVLRWPMAAPYGKPIPARS